jgi:TRAP-type C4-dicarboxylate transport system permease small subunit
MKIKKMHENLELLNILLVGLCAVFTLVFLIFGLVVLEGLLDKKLSALTAVLRASVYGGYTVIFATLMVCCVLGSAMCYVKKTERNRIAELELAVVSLPALPTIAPESSTNAELSYRV